MAIPSEFDEMPAIFGLWKTASVPVSNDAVSFGITSPEIDKNIAVWRLNLSNDPIQADLQLKRVERETNATQTIIEAIPDKIDHLVQQSRTQPNQQISFSTLSDDPHINAADVDLLQMLEDVKHQALYGTQDETASYGLLGSVDDWSQAGQQLQNLATRLFQMISNLAWIETSISGTLLGRTIIGWTGDTRTLWGTDFDLQRFDQHRRSLTLALASRHLLLRTLTVTAEGATKIAALLAIPGGPVLALPVIWKYTNRLLSEVQHYQQVTS